MTSVGIESALNYPLFKAIYERRSCRISKGIKEVRAGSLSYNSKLGAQPSSAYSENKNLTLRLYSTSSC